MPFKIVQTIEKGRPQLCIVPNLWEYKGLLRYPKKISDNKLARNENSKPQTDWRCMACTLKRGSLASYQEAEYELAIMLQNSDTENTTEEPNEVAPAAPSGDVDYNALADCLLMNQHHEQNDAAVVQEYENVQIIESSDQVPSILQHTIDQTLIHILNNQQEQNQQMNQLLADQQKLTNNQHEQNQQMNQLLANQQTLVETLNIIISNQKKITNRIASLSVQTDEIYKEVKNSSMQQKVITLSEVQNFDKEAFKIEPIDSITQLEEFESLVSNNSQRLKLMKQYSIFCSTSTGNGGTCAYKPLDVLFTREFMCKCSWSGGSRGDAIKIGLKGYKNILQFFFELVNYWDPTFTMDDNESFFKTVLKNANARKETMNARTSTKRKRCKKAPSDLKKKKKENSDKDKENQMLLDVVTEQNKNTAILPSVENDNLNVSESIAKFPSNKNDNITVSEGLTANLLSVERDNENVSDAAILISNEKYI